MRYIQRFQVGHGSSLEILDIVMGKIETFQRSQILQKSSFFNPIIRQIKMSQHLGRIKQIIGDIFDLIMIQFQVLKLNNLRLIL